MSHSKGFGIGPNHGSFLCVNRIYTNILMISYLIFPTTKGSVSARMKLGGSVPRFVISGQNQIMFYNVVEQSYKSTFIALSSLFSLYRAGKTALGAINRCRIDFQ